MQGRTAIRYGAISIDEPTPDDKPTAATYLGLAVSAAVPTTLALASPFELLEPLRAVSATLANCAARIGDCSTQAEFETALLADAQVTNAFKLAIFLVMLWAGPTAVFSLLNAILPPHQNQAPLTSGERKILRANIVGNIFFSMVGITFACVAYAYLQQGEKLHDKMVVVGLENTSEEELAQKQFYQFMLDCFTVGLAAVQGGILLQTGVDVVAAAIGATSRVFSPVYNGALATCRTHPRDLETGVPFSINADPSGLARPRLGARRDSEES